MLNSRYLVVQPQYFKQIIRLKSTKMTSPVSPPDCVRGMKVFKPEMFQKSASFPCLKIQVEQLNRLKKVLEKFAVKIPNLKTVQDTEESGQKIILLNPNIIKTFSDLKDVKEELLINQVNEDDLSIREFDLEAENWKPHEKLKYILPEDDEGVSGFSIIGHIIHLNLKESLLPYKNVIGAVLLETKNIKTVVTKTTNIDNTFRNFQLEVLAGENNFQVTVKENGINFTFDFSLVYWNPRLSTEHERIVKKLDTNSILLDACAGVGPFSIPAAKKCRVLANDLNPESFKWLKYNKEKNKIREDRIELYNLDAREFIKLNLPRVIKEIVEEGTEQQIHITLNLPGLAVTFMDVFQGVLADCSELESCNFNLPLVHVYTFSKAEDTVLDVRTRVEDNLGCSLDPDHLVEVAFVRNVAPNKDMLRCSFRVPRSILFDKGTKRRLNQGDEENDNSCKKMKE
ncbi:tRNA (guanine(37)-N1)-methyltransferase [Eurytemora carolleeae]|uniref:tRNA (guanine(37)-N1)-methyltransferase n=1 Tax=Eurytemora carolleeae TaxID=1294199 RepID=UPI000C776F59|nr:tRNA (guanine(37)-N1)-methyltransferase [Eurytemora carolleeae]|eukprot:XP_023347378.1 tRNA (guanine(37)-N1)-methyltransferase-like [Eurytemora affinis]